MTRGALPWMRHPWMRPAAWLLLLVLGVAWLALLAARESDRARRTADLLEHDYASFVADRLADASAERYGRLVGLSGLDAHRAQPSALSLLLERARDRAAGPLPQPSQPEIRYFFVYDAAKRRLSTSGPVADQELGALEARLAGLPRNCGSNQILPFSRLAQVAPGGGQDGADWSGFAETDHSGAVARVYGLRLDERRAIETFLVPLIAPERECDCLIRNLLPAALTRSADPVRSVSFILRAPTGEVVFRSQAHFNSARSVRRGLSSDIPFAGWNIEVAVDPKAVRPLLPYGGRDPSWLLLALLGALVLGSGALAVQSLRRNAGLVRLRQDFVANVSHELKTPLARIRLLNEVLLNRQQSDPDRVLQYRQVIDRECRRLGFLVDNVLDFARRERSSTPERAALNLRSLVEETADSFRVASADGCLSLVSHLEDVPPVLGDRSTLSRVLVNLLDNAVKYSPPRAPVDVSLRARDGWVELAVTDNGPGIPETERERIFEAFYRIEKGEAQRVAGSGLGLALVRQAVEAHGGSVGVESIVGHGSRFVVRLPVHSTEPVS
jgi:signal transduction histidine kinase